jgi:hypothetical protein
MTEDNGKIYNIKGKLKLTPNKPRPSPISNIVVDPPPPPSELPVEEIVPLEEKEIIVAEDVLEENGAIEQTSYPANKEFWLLALEKLTENFLSVKVWTIFAFMYISAYLCYTGHMTGTDFATANGSIISVVYAMREVFKTVKIKQAKNMEDIKRMKV